MSAMKISQVIDKLQEIRTDTESNMQVYYIDGENGNAPVEKISIDDHYGVAVVIVERKSLDDEKLEQNYGASEQSGDNIKRAKLALEFTKMQLTVYENMLVAVREEIKFKEEKINEMERLGKDRDIRK